MATDIQLVGTKGVSAWLVYNEVIFNLPFIERNTTKRRDFATELFIASLLDDVDQLKSFINGLAVDMIPCSKSREECLAEFKAMSSEEKESIFLELLMNIELSDEKVFRLLAVQKDVNGIPYTKANINNVKVVDLMPLMIDTMIACSEAYFDMPLVSAKQIEALGAARIDVREAASDIIINNPDLEAGEILSLAATKAMRGISPSLSMTGGVHVD